MLLYKLLVNKVLFVKVSLKVIVTSRTYLKAFIWQFFESYSSKLAFHLASHFFGDYI